MVLPENIMHRHSVSTVYEISFVFTAGVGFSAQLSKRVKPKSCGTVVEASI